jgi:hypothetical protein
LEIPPTARDSHFPTATAAAVRLHRKCPDKPPESYILKWLDTAVVGLYIRALGSIDRALLRSLQLKNEPTLGRTTQPPFTHISNRCNKKYELAQDNVLDYYLTASRRPRAKTGVTGPTAFKTFELGV